MPAVITFIERKEKKKKNKAFDSINRRKMLQILKAYGIPTLLVDAIGKTYEETRANVFSPDGKPNY